MKRTKPYSDVRKLLQRILSLFGLKIMFYHYRNSWYRWSPWRAKALLTDGRQRAYAFTSGWSAIVEPILAKEVQANGNQNELFKVINAEADKQHNYTKDEFVVQLLFHGKLRKVIEMTYEKSIYAVIDELRMRNALAKRRHDYSDVIAEYRRLRKIHYKTNEQPRPDM